MKLISKILILGLLFHFAGLYSQSAFKVDKVTITVEDLKRSALFFENVVKFKKVKSYTLRGEEFQRLVGIDNDKLYAEVIELQLGDELIALQEFHNEEKTRVIPLDSKSNDLWFQHVAIVVSDMEKAYKELKKAEVTHVSTSPQTLPDYIAAAAGIKAFYFQDPDRHNIEIIFFPKGKGDPKWQENSDEIFIGIDHTAIGIDKTSKSKYFYEELLGMKIVGHSENYGPEQEHLNQVFGASLLISGLRAQHGYGIEFLDYIAPPGGREYPKDSNPTDLWHWHTTIAVINLSETVRNLQKANVTFISNGIITLNGEKQIMVRDPDGHAVLLIEKN